VSEEDHVDKLLNPANRNLNDLWGTVVAVQANFYQVKLVNNPAAKSLLCTRRTRLKKIGQSVMVGDRFN
jgi:ribosome biogenesis GTPase / thiamine phosphate phosphatase